MKKVALLFPLALLSFSMGCTDIGSGLPTGSADDGSGNAPEGKSSGALIRVFNAYTPLNGEPGPIDLYPEPFVLEGATPNRSVPYGTLSEPFDPTVKDDDGNMFLSAYWGGTTGNGDNLVNKTETLKGGEVITYFIATGDVTQEGSGRRFGSIQAFFHDPPSGGLSTDVPAGKGLLTVSTIGLDKVLSAPESYGLYFGTGAGCTKAIGDTDFSQTGVGPGSAADFALDPGDYTGTVYNDATCAANPIVANVPFTIEEGGRNVLFVYAPKDKDFRSAVVPLTPKKASP